MQKHCIGGFSPNNTLKLKTKGVAQILARDLNRLKLGKLVGLVLLNDNDLGARLLASLKDLSEVLSALSERTEFKSVIFSCGLLLRLDE